MIYDPWKNNRTAIPAAFHPSKRELDFFARQFSALKKSAGKKRPDEIRGNEESRPNARTIIRKVNFQVFVEQP